METKRCDEGEMEAAKTFNVPPVMLQRSAKAFQLQPIEARA